MSSALLSALLVLQVLHVYGATLVLNGAQGESISLPTDVAGPINGTGLMGWIKERETIIRLVKRAENTSFEIRERKSKRFIMNNETGSLNISNLTREDSGEYTFNGLISSKALKAKAVRLQIYERIVSVRVTFQVNNSTDNSSCHFTLGCSVVGSHQVELFWTRNGKNITKAENKTTLTVSPTLAEEIYTCTAKNPISSQSNAVAVRSCQPPESSSFLYIYIAAGGGGLLLVMVIITLVCVLRKSKKGAEQADVTVYAEIGDNTQAHKALTADVSTLYDVIKGTENPAQPSTVYDIVNFERSTAQQYQEVL